MEDQQFDDILLRHCKAVNNQSLIERWTKRCILPYPKTGYLGLAKNYCGMTFTSIAAKIYNALFCNCVEPKIKKILMTNQDSYRRNRSTTSQILTIRRIVEGVRAKDLEASNETHFFTSSTCRPLHMDQQKQNDQLEPTYNSSVLKQHVALKTCRKVSMIEKDARKGQGYPS